MSVSLSYVKIVTPDPAAVAALLEAVRPETARREVAQHGGPDAPAEPGATGDLTLAAVLARRGGDGSGGFLLRGTEQPEFHVLRGNEPAIWAVTLGCDDVEGAHKAATAAGIACTPIQYVGTAGTSFFYAVAGGVTFEFLSAAAGR